MTDEHKEAIRKSMIEYWDKKREPRLQKNGYMTVTIENKKHYVHRLVMEEKIGRKLAADEHVHHINGDKTDNRIENLLLTTNSKHLSEHAKQRNFGCETGKEPKNKTTLCIRNEIKKLREEGCLLKDICKITKLSYPTVQKYAKGC